MSGFEAPEGKRFNNPFLSLKHPNFRYYWTGMCVSLVGTWMQNIAQPWLAYKLTHSAFLLSLIGTMQFLPIMLFSLFAGVWIDHLPKKKILIITQSVSGLIAFVLAFLVYTKQIEFWHILVMATLLGIVNTLDMPTRQSFVIELVGKADLTNAIALNSMAFNLARVIGPAVAGLVMGTFGIAVCFLVNGVSYFAVVFSLLWVKPLSQPIMPRTVGLLDEIKAGLGYILRTPTLKSTLVLVAIIGIFIPNFSVLVPVFVTEVFKANEKTFGLLMSAMGLGSFAGAMLVATMSKRGPNHLIMTYNPWLIGGLMAAIGFTHAFWQTAILLAITGFCFVAFSSSANSTMQTHTDQAYRGRVMSIYTLVFAGSTPIGSLFSGASAQHLGAGGGFMACGMATLLLLLATKWVDF